MKLKSKWGSVAAGLSLTLLLSATNFQGEAFAAPPPVPSSFYTCGDAAMAHQDLQDYLDGVSDEVRDTAEGVEAQDLLTALTGALTACAEADADEPGLTSNAALYKVGKLNTSGWTEVTGLTETVIASMAFWAVTVDVTYATRTGGVIYDLDPANQGGQAWRNAIGFFDSPPSVPSPNTESQIKVDGAKASPPYGSPIDVTDSVPDAGIWLDISEFPDNPALPMGASITDTEWERAKDAMLYGLPATLTAPVSVAYTYQDDVSRILTEVPDTVLGTPAFGPLKAFVTAKVAADSALTANNTKRTNALNALGDGATGLPRVYALIMAAEAVVAHQVTATISNPTVEVVVGDAESTIAYTVTDTNPSLGISYTFNPVTSGWYSLNSDGKLTVTPPGAADTTTFTIQAYPVGGMITGTPYVYTVHRGGEDYTVTVPPVTVTIKALSALAFNAPVGPTKDIALDKSGQTFSVAASGGKAPITYTWTLAPSDDRITLGTGADTGKVIVGEDTNTGDYPVTVKAVDADGRFVEQSFTISVTNTWDTAAQDILGKYATLQDKLDEYAAALVSSGISNDAITKAIELLRIAEATAVSMWNDGDPQITAATLTSIIPDPSMLPPGMLALLPLKLSKAEAIEGVALPIAIPNPLYAYGIGPESYSGKDGKIGLEPTYDDIEKIVTALDPAFRLAASITDLVNFVAGTTLDKIDTVNEIDSYIQTLATKYAKVNADLKGLKTKSSLLGDVVDLLIAEASGLLTKEIPNGLTALRGIVNDIVDANVSDPAVAAQLKTLLGDAVSAIDKNIAAPVLAVIKTGITLDVIIAYSDELNTILAQVAETSTAVKPLAQAAADMVQELIAVDYAGIDTPSKAAAFAADLAKWYHTVDDEVAPAIESLPAEVKAFVNSLLAAADDQLLAALPDARKALSDAIVINTGDTTLDGYLNGLAQEAVKGLFDAIEAAVTDHGDFSLTDVIAASAIVADVLDTLALLAQDVADISEGKPGAVDKLISDVDAILAALIPDYALVVKPIINAAIDFAEWLQGVDYAAIDTLEEAAEFARELSDQYNLIHATVADLTELSDTAKGIINWAMSIFDDALLDYVLPFAEDALLDQVINISTGNPVVDGYLQSFTEQAIELLFDTVEAAIIDHGEFTVDDIIGASATVAAVLDTLADLSELAVEIKDGVIDALGDYLDIITGIIDFVVDDPEAALQALIDTYEALLLVADTYITDAVDFVGPIQDRIDELVALLESVDWDTVIEGTLALIEAQITAAMADLDQWIKDVLAAVDVAVEDAIEFGKDTARLLSGYLNANPAFEIVYATDDSKTLTLADPSVAFEVKYSTKLLKTVEAINNAIGVASAATSVAIPTITLPNAADLLDITLASVPAGFDFTDGVLTVTDTSLFDYDPAGGLAKFPVSLGVTTGDATIEALLTEIGVVLAKFDVEIEVVSNTKVISAFSLGVAGETVAIDETAGTITVTDVPFGTDITAITPVITWVGDSIDPVDTDPQDFESSVTYKVIAADGTDKTYTVTVTVDLNPANDIVTFTLPDVLGTATGVIDPVALTINVEVAYGTDVTNLTPTVTVSDDATLLTTGPQDFTTPVAYTVKAENGDEKTYTVTVTHLLNHAKEITKFDIGTAVGVIDEVAGAIVVTVPFGTDVTNLNPTIVWDGAFISRSGAQDFSDSTTTPLTYTVRAENGTQKTYAVTVTVAANTAKDITSFTVPGADVDIVEVDETTGTIAVSVPFGTDVTALTPTISITGAGVSPASGVVTDFTTSQLYVVTAADTSTKTYTVTVTAKLNPAKEITDFTLAGVDGVIVDVDETAGTITVTDVPFGTDLTALTPTVVVSGTASLLTTGAQDFSSGSVDYVVKAADGSEKTYTVTVTAKSNPAKDIESFTVAGVDGAIVDVDETTGIITVSDVPFSTDLTALTPTVVVSGTASLLTTGPQDFSSGSVEYEVQAADGTIKTYTVTVAKESAPIYSVSLDKTGTLAFGPATVGYGAQTPVTVTVSNTGNRPTGALGVALTGADPTAFTVSPATVGSIGVGSDATFTVVPNARLAPGTYTATVTVTSATGITESFDVSFTVDAAPVVKYSLTVTGGTGAGSYAAGTSVAIVAGAAPAGQQFDKWVVTGAGSVASVTSASTTFTMPAGAATVTATYKVIPSSAKDITKFTVAGVDATIAGSSIAVTVPFGTDVSKVSPTISVSAGASVSPSGVQDFTKPVAYTVKAADGTTKTYTVTVSVAPAVIDPDMVYTPLYRFYNWDAGTHFYTADETEKNDVIDKWDHNVGKGPFSLDGVVAQVVPSKVATEANQVVVYRFYMPATGTHFYSSSEEEVKFVKTMWPEVFTYEGPAYVAYAATSDGTGCAVTGTIPLYRFYNNVAGVHFYTADETERDAVIDQWDYASGKGPFSLDGLAYCVIPK